MHYNFWDQIGCFLSVFASIIDSNIKNQQHYTHQALTAHIYQQAAPNWEKQQQP